MKDEMIYPPEYSDRDWKEDFSHENGNYVCICSAGCKKQFYGHKRRVLCRTCAIPKPICGENCGCQTGEDCYGEAGLNLVEKLTNELIKSAWYCDRCDKQLMATDVHSNETCVQCGNQVKSIPQPLQAVDANKEVEDLDKIREQIFSNGIPEQQYGFIMGVGWQQSQSIESIVGFVLEWVANDMHLLEKEHFEKTKAYLMSKKSVIIKQYNNGK